MTISRNRKPRVFLLLIFCSFIAAHLCFRLLPNLFEIGNNQAVDQLYILRASFQKFRPAYDHTVAHVDLNNASIQRLKNLYLNRGHYARLIRNLSAMGVSAQVFDFIFAAKKDEKADAGLVGAANEAGNVYFGMASDDRDELELWGEELQGKIVIVSDISTGSTDIGPVPTDANFPLSGVHASIINGILTESFLKELSGWQMLLFEVLLLAAILVMALRFSCLYFSMGTLLVAAGYIIIAGAAFIYGNCIFHLGRPLLMIAFAMVSSIIYLYVNEEMEKMEGLRQRDFIRATFGRYLSGEVVEELLDSPQGLKMSGEIREATFLVSDLRGFSALTARLSPHETIEVINRYFEHMLEVIARYRGVVNEFMGDGILVFFGAPLQAEDDPERAVACAIEMQNAMGPF